MKKSNRFFSTMAIALFVNFNALAIQKDTAIALDMDDVMSIKEKVGAMDYLPLARAIFWNPWVLSVLINMNGLKEQGEQLAQSMNGSGNVIHAMIGRLKDQGYGDFSDYELEIIDRATKPRPIEQMVELVKDLKKDGYIIIGATNQDLLQHQAYRKKMKEQGVDLNKLFDAVLVTRVHHIEPKKTKDGYSQPIPGENIAVAAKIRAVKPNAEYFEVLERLAKNTGKKKGIDIEKIIFTDDKKENAQGAQKVGIDAHHFDLAGGSARKTSPEDLQKTVDGFRQKLQDRGVIVGN